MSPQFPDGGHKLSPEQHQMRERMWRVRLAELQQELHALKEQVEGSQLMKRLQAKLKKAESDRDDYADKASKYQKGFVAANALFTQVIHNYDRAQAGEYDVKTFADRVKESVDRWVAKHRASQPQPTESAKAEEPSESTSTPTLRTPKEL